jgi:YD repeat-containing protein
LLSQRDWSGQFDSIARQRPKAQHDRRTRPPEKFGTVTDPAQKGALRDRITKNVYDPAGRLIETWDGVGTPLQRREALYTYDGNGQRTSLTDARGFPAARG